MDGLTIRAATSADLPLLAAMNPGGRRFWERMGLRSHCTTMILAPGG